MPTQCNQESLQFHPLFRLEVPGQVDGGAITTDAVPALVAGMPKLSQAERRDAATRVLAQWLPPTYSDWRTWSWSRHEAWRTTKENGPSLLCWKAGNT